MDSFDHQILALLRRQARLPVSRIAESVNLSRPAVSERIARLERTGVIRGYHASIAPPQGGAVKAFLQIVHDHHLCQRYADLLAGFPEVGHRYAISGETDMLVEVEAASLQRLNEILQALQAFPGLRGVRTHVVLQDWPG